MRLTSPTFDCFMLATLGASLVLARFGAKDLRVLSRQALIGIPLYLLFVVGGRLESSAIRVAFAHTGNPTIVFVLGMILYTAGLAVFLGWVQSPGGFRYSVVPFAVLLKSWPRTIDRPPFTPDQLRSWSKSSWICAVTVFGVVTMMQLYLLQRFLHLLHSTAMP